MLKYFVLFWNLFVLICTEIVIDHNPILDPVELVLRSSDAEGFFYCNGHVDLKTQQAKLVASLVNPHLASSTMVYKTEQINSTTIRIRIKPNGYIGANRIHCYWNNNQTFGSIADLIIGESPGVITLKDRCLAFDRRYVQCTFIAPIIGRAFKNGFPKLFTFAELNKGSSPYHTTPELVDITQDNELVFQFQPIDRHDFPRKNYMGVNMTLKRFGSSYYKFVIEPLHTTKVNFDINNISSREFTIHINHNNSGTIHPRLCSGRLSQIAKDKSWTAIQDIMTTIDLKILIKRLRPSTEYEICLKCYYELDDESYKQEVCRRTTTLSSSILYLLLIVIGLLTVILSFIGILLFLQRDRVENWLPRLKPRSRKHSINSNNERPLNHYDSEPMIPHPGEDQPLTGTETPVEIPHVKMENSGYLLINDILKDIMAPDRIAPDTVDLTRHRTNQ